MLSTEKWKLHGMVVVIWAERVSFSYLLFPQDKSVWFVISIKSDINVVLYIVLVPFLWYILKGWSELIQVWTWIEYPPEALLIPRIFVRLFNVF